MEERRRFVRLDTRLEVDYQIAPSGDAQVVVTKDISAGGICFFADRVLKPGTRLTMRLMLPGRAQPIQCTAEAVWSDQYELIGKGRRQRSVEVGVRFLEISPADQAAIMQHVILGFQSPPAVTRGQPPSALE